MQLLRFADVPTSKHDRVFRYSRGRVLVMATSAIAVSILLIALGRQQHSPLLDYIAAVLVVGLIVMQTFVTARFRPTNWLVRANDDGLFVHFRSYLNYRFPADRPTVAFIPYGAIRSACAVRERRELPDPDSSRHPNSTTIQRSTTVHLDLTGDLDPLARAVDDEARLALGELAGTPCLAEAAEQRRRARTRYRHVPVRLSSARSLELEWAVAPRAATLLALLSSHGVPTDTTETTQDYAHLETLGRDEQEQRLLELVERGDTIAAIRIARQLYGWDLTRAKAFVEGLRGPRRPSTPNTLR